MAGQTWRRMDRWLSWLHRWAGVVLSSLFLIWFLSGAVLHFVGFPGESGDPEELPPTAIALDRVAVAPAAATKGPDADGLRLISVAGRPVYVVSHSDGSLTAVAADTGEALPLFSAATAQKAAELFDGVRALRVSGPVEYDQWIVPNEFDAYRPAYRVLMSDASGTELYVSARTGEVVQKITAAERKWNWCGAILHWIYFTPLRKNAWAWSNVVWYTALVGMISVIIGIWLGFVRFINNRAARRRGISPFRGWMRWHHVIGLFACVVVLGWLLSGWTSMDDGRIFPTGTPTQGEVDGLRGLPFSGLVQTVTAADLRAAGTAGEISLEAIGGRPFLEVWPPKSLHRHVLSLGTNPEAAPQIGDSELQAALSAVWPGRIRGQVPRDQYDALYRLGEYMPTSAVGYRLSGPGDWRVYVDGDSGQLIILLGPGRRAYDWLFFALHTLNFPGLLDHPFLRTVIEMLLLAVGTAFCATGVVLSVKRLKRSFS
jgi:uncharacterized iron-regulated membrane protein